MGESNYRTEIYTETNKLSSLLTNIEAKSSPEIKITLPGKVSTVSSPYRKEDSIQTERAGSALAHILKVLKSDDETKPTFLRPRAPSRGRSSKLDQLSPFSERRNTFFK